MMRSNFSRLAVLGLAAVSSQVFAAVNVSGEVRTDLVLKSKPEYEKSTFELSRARLNFKGDVSPHWMLNARLEHFTFGKGTNSEQEAVVLPRAYAVWTGLEGMTLSLGKAGHRSVSADDNYYCGYVTGHGVLSGFEKDEVGLSLKGDMGSFGYNVALTAGDKTKVNAADKNDTGVVLNMSGRLTFSPIESDSMSLGMGAGYFTETHEDRELKTSLINFADNSADPLALGAQTTDATILFSKLEGFTVDMSAVMDRIALTGAYFNAKHKAPKADKITGSPTNNPFDQDGKSDAFYLDVAYLVMGDNYHFAHGGNQGPRFKGSALEVGARYSQVKRKNSAQLLHEDLGGQKISSDGLTFENYFTDQQLATYSNGAWVSGAANHQASLGSVDDTATAPATAAAGAYTTASALERKTDAFSIYANYHVNSNAVVKVEYYHGKAKTTDTMLNTAHATAAALAENYLKEMKNDKITVRAEFKF